MLKKYVLLFLLQLSFTFAFAQIQAGGTPYSFKQTNALSKNIPQKIMDADVIDIPRMLAEDDIDMQVNEPMRFAYRFDVDYNLENSGIWEVLPNGDRIWRLNIWSPGAMNISLAYSDFYMPEGGKLYVYDQDKKEVIGAFTAKNNQAHRMFTTRMINHDKITVEYFEPKAVRGKGALSIMTVAHGYRNLDGQTAAERAGGCQVNVNCPEGFDWLDQKKGVARIVMDNAFLCSGTLINNEREDCRLFFSTANHCVMGTGHDAIANGLAPLYTFYWNYECPADRCNDPDGGCGANLDNTTAGCTVVVSSGGSGQGVGGLDLEYGDFALLELTESPVEAQYDVYFNGWDRRGNPDGSGYLPQALTGIHHPAGDEKKISTDFPSNGPLGATNVGQETVVIDGQYWEFFWEPTQSGHAVTEGGSSGSPLFDSETQLVIGQLFGGSSDNCGSPFTDRAVYGGFFYSFENGDNPSAGLSTARRLQPWLDPDNTGVESVPGRYPCGITPPAPFVAFTTQSTDTDEKAQTDVPDDCLDYTDYEIGIRVSSVPDVAVPVTVAINTSATLGMDYDVMSPTSFTLGATRMESTKIMTIRIYDDSESEGLEALEFSYSIDGGYTGNAITGTLNQVHLLSIEDNDPTPALAGSTVVEFFNEDFSTSDGNPAYNWFSDQVGGSTHFWQIGNNNTDTDDAGMTGGCAFVSSTILGGYSYQNISDDETSLIGDVDATGYEQLVLTFDWASEGEAEGAINYDFGTVMYSEDGGTSFNVLPTAYNLNSTGATASVALPASLDGTSFELGFKWQHDLTAGSDQPMAVDNIKISGVSVGAAIVATSETNIADYAEVYLGPNSSVHLYEATNNNVMMTISNNSTHDFGCTMVGVDRAGTSAETYWGAGSEITSKTFVVIPENPMSGQSLSFDLYYTEAEIAGWEAANTDLNQRVDLQMIQADGPIQVETGTNVAVENATSGTFESDLTYSATFITPGSTTYGYALGQAEVTLAVKLTTLTATPKDRSILLNWKTSNEYNNKSFEVQRSLNPVNGFMTIGQVKGKGTTNVSQSYDFEDYDVSPGHIYYYRLLQVDQNDKGTLSHVVQATLEAVLDVAISPNPVHEYLQVNILAKKDVDGTLRVLDLLGRPIWEQDLEVTEALNVTIDTKDFTNGVYLLQIVLDGEVMNVQKFVKE